MKRYVKGKNYNVQQGTKHQHHRTWAKIVREIEALGAAGAAEEDLRNICRTDKNPQYLSYIVKHGWLRVARRP